MNYTKTAIFLHWLMAFGLIVAFSLGIYMTELPFSPQKLKFYAWHKWLGITLFTLVIIRLTWRLTHPIPQFSATMSIWERHAAQFVHFLLYFLMLAIPLSGWLMSSAAGFPVVFLGWIPLPDLVAKNKELADLFKQIHWTFNLSLFSLVILHLLAALKHHFIVKDNVLVQMLPLLRRDKKC